VNTITNAQDILASNTFSEFNSIGFNAVGFNDLLFLRDITVSLDIFAAILSVLLLGKIVFSGGGLQDIVLFPWGEGMRGGEKRSLLNQRVARRHA